MSSYSDHFRKIGERRAQRVTGQQALDREQLRRIACEKFEPFYPALDALKRAGVIIVEDGRPRTVPDGSEMRGEVERLQVPQLRQVVTRTRNVTISLVTASGRLNQEDLGDLRYRCVLRDHINEIDNQLFTSAPDAVNWFINTVVDHEHSAGEPPPSPLQPAHTTGPPASPPRTARAMAAHMTEQLRRREENERLREAIEAARLDDEDSSPEPQQTSPTSIAGTSHYRDIVLDD